VVVILVSAFQRLLLYENAYGFTRIRIQTLVLMIWLGILLLAALVLELINRPRAFGLAALLVSFGFGLTLNIIDPDAMIVKLNLQSNYTKRELDAQYLVSLSSDAVPNLTKAFLDSNLPGLTHDQLGAVLSCARYNLNQDRQDQAWQSFHFSRHAAEINLQSIDSDLDAYPVLEEEWRYSVKIGSEVIWCQPYFSD
ncbi:MAG: DUF4173 domain-containing protein, partial [Anaerolineaceae bacterium]|nr:DUF4173 domain-containing protein [Anaerolineaceae bacterium]